MNNISLITRIRKSLRFIAIFLAVNFLYELIFPTIAFALTGGPSQPEVQSFEPVGTTDMVDLFTGDFNYNIPLLDVEGYPVNISYHGGITADQEASWVGLGWNINPGVINRGMRGLPDDFKGDEIIQEMETKPSISTSLGFNSKWEAIGKKLSAKKIEKFLSKAGKLAAAVGVNVKTTNLDLGFSLGIRWNNYRGYGMSLGLKPEVVTTQNLAQQTVETSADGKSSSVKDKTTAVGGKSVSLPGLNFDSQEGTSMNYAINLKSNKDKDNGKQKDGTPVSVGFNSREGFKSATVGKFNISHYCAPTHIPNNKTAYTHWGVTGHLHVGPELSYLHSGWGMDFSYMFQQNRHNGIPMPIKGYGTMYHDEVFQQKDMDDFVFDFNRYSDEPVGSTTPNLPYAMIQPDNFGVSGQGISGSYKIKHKYIPVVYDDEKRSNSTDINFGFDFGAGAWAKFGWDIEVPFSTSRQGVKKLDRFERNAFTKPLSKDVYRTQVRKPFFKNLGEMTSVDENYRNKLKTDESYSPFKIKKEFDIRNTVQESFKKTQKDLQNSVFQYLTKAQLVQEDGFTRRDHYIYNYPKNSVAFVYNENNGLPSISNVVERTFQKNHHIASVSVLAKDGSTYVYDIPAMNIIQIEHTFSVAGADLTAQRYGLCTYSKDGSKVDFQKNNSKIIYYNQQQTLPSFAHSYLLTGVQSPDYVDISQDGITDDDYGNAVRFNYTRTSDNYPWRTPYETNQANLQAGNLSNPYDDKGSYVYGEKEMWYMHSIESKNFIALFYLSDRTDGLGVLNEDGGKNTSAKLQRLDSIVLYSKADLKFNQGNAIPIKKVHFVYETTNPLCKGIPNSSVVNGGKLTLKEIYFTYGNSFKGQYTGYKFNYSSVDPQYNIKSYDRWGNHTAFKDPGSSPDIYSPLSNAEFPYTTQNKTDADHDAQAWSLTEVELPSGGKIEINYESDDYAYVQDKKAMQMMLISGTGKTNTDFDPAHGSDIREVPLYDNNFGKGQGNRQNYNYIFFKRKTPGDDIQKYFTSIESSDTLFFSVYMQIMEEDSKKYYEHITGFAPLATDNQGKIECGAYNSDYGWVKVKQVSITDRDLSNREVNAIVKLGMNQTMEQLPQYVYKGSNPKQSDYSMLDGMITAFAEFKNIFYSRYKTLMDKNYCRMIMANKSFIRLNTPDGFKYGGGSRVKKITMSDNWIEMQGSSSANYTEGKYGQEYDYTTMDENGNKISSGVASFEPQIGGMENPFKMPVLETIIKNNSYLKGKTQAIYSALKVDKFVKKKYLYHIGPVGEDFYPGASVGYSKVTVKDLASANGKTVTEFYTAKDFPTIVKPGIVTMLSSDGDTRGTEEGNRPRNGGSSYSSLTVSKLREYGLDIVGKKLFEIAKKKWLQNTNDVVRDGISSKTMLDLDFDYGFKSCFQGYTIINNDMHGKMRKQTVFSYSPRFKTDIVKSSVEYIYKRIGNTNQLDNQVQLYNYKDNTVYSGRIGEDMDLTYDKQEERIFSADPGFEQNIDASGAAPIPGFVIKLHGSKNNYKSRVLTKIINQTGILDKVIATEDNASVSTENLLYDAYTGDVILTKTQNEFNDNIYNLTLASWYADVHQGMSHADNNWGEEGNFVVTSGEIDYSTYINSLLAPGDELLLQDPLVSTTNYKKAWLHQNGGQVLIIDTLGYPVGDANYHYIVMRSGRRNQLSVPMGNYVLLDNPIKSGHLLIPDSMVINSSAVLFSENWQPYRQPTVSNRCSKFTSTGDQFKQWIQKLNNSHIFGKDTSFYTGDYLPSVLKSCSCGGHTADSYQINKSVSAGSTVYTYIIGYKSGGVFHSCNACNPSIIIPKCSTVYTNTLRYILYTQPNKTSFLYEDTLRNIDEYEPAYVFYPSSNYEVNPGYDSLHFDTTYAFYVDQDIYDATSIDSFISGKEIDTITSVDYYPIDFNSISYVDTSKCNILSGSTPPQEFSFPVIIGDGVPVLAKLRLDEGCDDVHLFDDCCTRCTEPPSRIVNPYLAGTKGIWRKKADYAFHGKRRLSESSGLKKPDIRKDGVFVSFNPFWEYNSATNTFSSLDQTNWQKASEVTVYTPHGNEVENKNALGIFSSAIYGYNNKMPILVAQNAKYTQVAFDGFEDYIYDELPAACDLRHFNFLVQSSVGMLDSAIAHSGKYSYLLNAGDSFFLERNIKPAGYIPAISPDPGRLIPSNSEMVQGYNPDTGTYLIGAWVREDFGTSQSLKNKYTKACIRVKLKSSCGDNSPLIYTFYASGPVIEGWQRIEGKFQIPVGYVFADIGVVASDDVNTNFDDIRIHPYDGNVKTYVFNQKTMKLMAELDENNYASFYEYDLEGQMIRVKKETIKGIVTLKEVRMGLKKK